MKKTLIVSLFFIVSGLLGFFCQLFYAKYFGSGKEMDIYFSLLSIPSIITGIIPVIFTSLFLPIFSKKKDTELYAYIYEIKNIVTIFAIIFAFIGFLSTFFNIDMIINTSESKYINLAKVLAFLLWINAFLSVMNGFFSSVQNYFKNFIVLSGAPLLIYVFILISIVLFHQNLGINSIALGMTIGTIIQFAIYRMYGQYYHRPIIKVVILKKDLLTKMIYIIISLLPFTMFANISYSWASKTNMIGGVSLLGYSHSFSGFLSVAASMGLATVSFPDLARNLASNDYQKIEKGLYSFRSQIDATVIFASFVAVFMSFFIHPILNILFLRGHFDSQAVANLSTVMPLYLIDSVMISVMNLTRNVYYSLEKFKSFAFISFIVTIGFILSSIFIGSSTSYVGIGIAEVLMMFCFVFISLFVINMNVFKIFNIQYILNILLQIVIFIFFGYITSLVYLKMIQNLSTFVSLIFCCIIYVSTIVIIFSLFFKSSVIITIINKIINHFK